AATRSPLRVGVLARVRVSARRLFRCWLLAQTVCLSLAHLTGIDESRHAHPRHLLDRARHAGAQGLAADRIGVAIALIVDATILLHPFGDRRHGWSENEDGGGDCHGRGGTISGFHVTRSC